MLSNWKQRILKGWGLMRIIRLSLAIIVLIESWKNSEILFAFLGGIIFLQAFLGIGCCGVGGCDINHTSNKSESASRNTEEITFNEVK